MLGRAGGLCQWKMPVGGLRARNSGEGTGKIRRRGHQKDLTGNLIEVVYFWNLPSWPRSLQDSPMRLPPRSLRYFPVRTAKLAISGLAILLGVMPARAQAEQLICTPAAVRFGTIVVGKSETVPMALTNTGSTAVTISEINSPVAAFTVTHSKLPITVPAGQSVDFNVTFAPRATGWVGQSISVVSSAHNRMVFIGTGGFGVTSESLKASPSTLAFGNVPVGTSATLPVTLINSGTTEIRLAQAQSTGTGFTLGGPALPVWLAPKKSVTFKMTFAPQATGTVSGTLSTPNGGLTVPLTGTGTGITKKGQLTITPAALNFGDVTVGTTQTQQIGVSASGASVTISSNASSNSQFVLDGASFPLTIPAGKSVSYNVSFSPRSSGTASGKLSFASNASTSTTLESVTGIGTTTQYSVHLSWNPSKSVVVGYNVYRATGSSGSYSKINSTVDPSTAYTDSTVASDQTYYYAATSVNSSGQESAYSTATKAVIP
jgi:hypothetical protein